MELNIMKIRNLDLTRNPINVEHQQLGLPPVEEPFLILEHTRSSAPQCGSSFW